MKSSDIQKFHKEKTELFELERRWADHLEQERKEQQEQQEKQDQQDGPFVSYDHETAGEDRYWSLVRNGDYEDPVSLIEGRSKKAVEVVNEIKDESSFDNRDKDSDPKNDGRVYSEDDLLELEKLALEKTEMESMLAKLDAEGSDTSSMRNKLDSLWKEYDELSSRLSGGRKQD